MAGKQTDEVAALKSTIASLKGKVTRLENSISALHDKAAGVETDAVGVGSRVWYTLGEYDINQITYMRKSFLNYHSDIGWPEDVRLGEVYPAEVSRVHADGVCNLRILLDGWDTYYVKNRPEGEGMREWRRTVESGVQ